MARASLEDLKKRSKAAWTDKQGWRDLLESAYEMAIPNRDNYKDRSAGDRRTDKIFDSTAVSAVTRFAGRMQSDLTPPFQRWFELKAGPLVPEDQRDNLDRLLEPITEKVVAVLNSGEFNTAIHEFYQDLASGTAILYIAEGDDRMPVRFVCVPQSQVALEEGPFGSISGYYRKHKIKVRNIMGTWADAKIPSELEDKENPNKEVTLDECVYFDENTKKWYYDIIWTGGDTRLVEREYTSQPFIGSRWSKTPGETHGRGPLLAALPDIKTVNKVVEMLLKNAALAIAGVYTVADDDVTNIDNIRVAPAAFIQVKSNGGALGPSIAPLDTARNFDVTQFVLDDLRMNIKKLMLDNQLPPDAGPVRSATEIVARMKELSQDAGAAFGRLINELIIPLIGRVLDILSRKGIVAEKVDVNQLFVKAQVISPLARVQNLADIENVLRWLEIIITTGGPQAMMLSAKIEDIYVWIADQLGVPAELVRPEAERKQIQKQVAETLAAQAQAQQAQNDNPDNARAGTGSPDGMRLAA